MEAQTHSLTAIEVERELKTDSHTGLKADEAQRRLNEYGLNTISEANESPLYVLILSQFKNPIVYLLLGAAGLSFAYSKWIDGIAILIVLIINAAIGFFMEFKAEQSMKSLKSLATSFSKVFRDGRLQEIPAEQFVPGDILYVEAGDIVTADARVVAPTQLQVDESAMTGESIPVEKADVVLPKETVIADRKNTLYKGTFITRGNTKAIVCATGMATELGKIATMVQRAQDSATPIEKKLEQFSKKLIWITLFIAGIIFVTGVINGKGTFEMLTTVIALAVAAIPEGLPIVATLALAHGMIKMARRNVIVKKLGSVETLGGTNIICTDKTGTLTLNKIEVSHLVTSDHHGLRQPDKTKSSELIIKAAILCNTAHLDSANGANTEIGDPLEIGLLRFAETQLSDILEIRTRFPKIMEEPFRSETKIMATLHNAEDGKIAFAKGASEEIIRLCTRYLDGNDEKEFTNEQKLSWLAESEKEAENGFKVIAFAFKNHAHPSATITNHLTFLGITSLVDPPREDVPEAIKLCHRAGIKVIMVTGDHPSTAKNIAQQIGIIPPGNHKIIQGSAMPNFDLLSKEQKLEWKTSNVFARVSPRQKLDLIEVLQEDKQIVAMTGDGVNDAPALKKADIGIAMGLRGTAVAKEVADVVLKDDSFTSIVVAIKEGRIIFENIRKFLMFLLSSNLSEIIVIAALFVSNSPLVIVPLQILFINLLSDVFPALALGFSSGSAGIMERPPRDPGQPVLSNRQWISVIIYAIVIAAFTFGSAVSVHESFDHPQKLREASTVLFYTLILSQMIHVFNVSDHRVIFYKSDVFRNKYVWAGVTTSGFLAVVVYFLPPTRNVLNIGNITGLSLLIIVSFSLGSFLVIQILKKFNLVH